MRAKRIQRRRARGWKMPPTAIYVGRPTQWGNPFIVGVHGTRAQCVGLFEKLCMGYVAVSVDTQCLLRQLRFLQTARAHIEDLRGHDLACFCPTSSPCHADVLLRIANTRPGKKGGGR